MGLANQIVQFWSRFSIPRTRFRARKGSFPRDILTVRKLLPNQPLQEPSPYTVSTSIAHPFACTGYTACRAADMLLCRLWGNLGSNGRLEYERFSEAFWVLTEQLLYAGNISNQ